MRPNFDTAEYSHVVDQSRVAIAAETESDLQRNCFGTARFLSGENSGQDAFADAESTVEILEGRAALQEPALGCYIVLDGFAQFDKKISHMGVVVNLDPLQMMHRSRRQGPLRVDAVADVTEHFHQLYQKQQIPGYTGIDVRYYANPNTQLIAEE